MGLAVAGRSPGISLATSALERASRDRCPRPGLDRHGAGDFDAGEHIELSKCIHAEAKLIAQAARDGMSLNDATLYVTTYPCPPCAKLVATAGIKKVYYRDGYSLLDAEDIFNAYAIEITLVKMSSQDVSV